MRIALMSCALLSATLLHAQQPDLVHAQLTVEPATQTLAGELAKLERAATPAWVGYSVPVLNAYRSGWNGSSRTELLEGNSWNWNTTDKGGSPSPEQQRANVLFRVAGGKVEKLRLEAADRQLDAGGLRFVWLPGVTPEDSIAVLKQQAEQGGHEVRDTAVFLIAEQRSEAAVPALIGLTAAGEPAETRERAAFWLANQRGHEGFLAIRKLDRDDPDAKFREKLAFDLTLSKDPEALDELIRMAKEDSSPQVRSQAQFWMGTRGGERVAGVLQNSADNDPDKHARGQAVFAISRLPAGEAEPKLEELAQTSKDPYVRQQAVFWLGQSHDPRALAYLTRLIQTPAAKTQ